MLTRKQHDLLMFIHKRLQEVGVPPSFDEMKDALDLKSKSGIHRLITALEERGFIRRLPNRARALEVLKLPESHAPAVAEPQVTPSFKPSAQMHEPVQAANDDMPEVAYCCGYPYICYSRSHALHRRFSRYAGGRRTLRIGSQRRFYD